jgi:hypothetical protein
VAARPSVEMSEDELNALGDKMRERMARLPATHQTKRDRNHTVDNGRRRSAGLGADSGAVNPRSVRRLGRVWPRAAARRPLVAAASPPPCRAPTTPGWRCWRTR